MNIVLILQTNYAGAEWSISGNDYEGLTWLSDSPKPSKATLESLWAEVQIVVADAQTAKNAARQTVLNKLGLTQDEAAALLG